MWVRHMKSRDIRTIARRRKRAAVAGIIPSRYTSLISLRFTVQWIYAGLVAHLYLLYEDTRMRYPLLSFSYVARHVETVSRSVAEER